MRRSDRPFGPRRRPTNPPEDQNQRPAQPPRHPEENRRSNANSARNAEGTPAQPTNATTSVTQGDDTRATPTSHPPSTLNSMRNYLACSDVRARRDSNP